MNCKSLQYYTIAMHLQWKTMG